MIYTILLLGLLPALFLPDGSSEPTGDIERDAPDDPVGETVDVAGAIGIEDPDPALLPVLEDDVATDGDADGDAIAPVVGDDVIDDTILAPVIEVDAPGDPTGDTDPALSPAIEDDQASEASPDDPGDVLAPVIEDDQADGLAGSDVLAPVQEDDVSRQFLLQFNGEVAASPVEVFGFDSQSDTLLVGSDTAVDLKDCSVEINQSETDPDTHVHVNGALIAVLRNCDVTADIAVALEPSLSMKS